MDNEIMILDIRKDLSEIENIQNELEVNISKGLYIDDEIYGYNILKKIKKNHHEILNDIISK